MSIAPPVQVSLKSLSLSPGSCLTIDEISWDEFEAIQAAFDERPGIRVAYCDGTLELVSPLPAHERPNRIIADIVKAILDAQQRDWEDFGSSTLRRQPKLAGVEPDTALYIQNAERMRDCLRFDLEIDPPPDLAIESDLTSKTTLEAYERLQVPELWIYGAGQLRINVIVDDRYLKSEQSLLFPELPIVALIPALLQQAFVVGTSRMLREFRRELMSV
jgi:Uma2 family endonuclease